MLESNKNYYIDVDQLTIGIYVHLDLGWMDHPFKTSNFKISSVDQIATIKKMGLKRLRYDPKRSDSAPPPLPEKVSDEDTVKQTNITPPVTNPIIEPQEPTQTPQEKLIQRLQQMHQTMDECEKKFISAGNTAQMAMKNIVHHPKQAVEQAEQLINEMVDSALNESEIAVIAVSGNRSDERNHVHSLNVMVLALMMARTLNMTEEDARLLGTAALFHDVGKAELPTEILLKKEPLSNADQMIYERHSQIGAEIAKKAGLSDRIANIIMQHHEYADGTGYPKRLKIGQIDPLASLLLMINHYDYLCNPHDIAHSKTPYESLAHMFARERAKFDDALLKQLIKTLGVYPPGSIVQLSNGLYGIVVSVNPLNPLRPVVMLYDKEMDRNSPLIVSLRENTELSISVCIRPNQLPKDALAYLSPRKRINYYWGNKIDSEPQP